MSKTIQAFTKRKEGKLIAVASSEIKDRVGDTLLSKGWQLKNFKRNPVLMFGHKYAEPPIGIAKNIKVSGNNLIFEPTFHGITQLSREVKAMYEAVPPIMRAFSVGFIPLEIDEKDQHIIRKQELLEISAVPIPANQEALIIAAKSYTSKEEINVKNWIKEAIEEKNKETEEKKEETEEEKPKKTEEEIEEKKPEKETEEESEDKEKEEEKGEETENEETEKKPEEETEEDKEEIEEEETEEEENDETEEETEKDTEIEEGKDKEEGLKVEEKPYPNEHACRLEDPGKYKRVRRNNCYRKHDGKCIDFIWGVTKDKEKVELQAMRYPKDVWTVSSAKTHCGNAGGSFEAATGKNIESKSIERWNKTLSKVFDVAKIESKPSNFCYDLFTKFLECKIKDVFLNSYFVPSPLMGSYLAGFKKVLNEFELKDTRNFTYNGLELPPIYEVIKLNSKESDDFLIQGVKFFVANEKLLIVKYTPVWQGIDVSIITSNKNKDWNKELMGKVHNWVKENNCLKGEKFALNGEFLPVSDCEDWDEVILEKDIKESVMKSVKFLNKKGKELISRGLLFIGVPGTGKTLTGRVIMDKADSTFIWVSSKDFERFSPTSLLSLSFSLARKLAPTVLFIEDIDTWLGGHSVDLLKTELDGIRVNKGIITILTSNTPEKLPDSLIDRPGRFHDVLKFDLPNKKIRGKMIIKWALAGKVESEAFVDKIVEGTEGYSGAHIKELVEYAKIIVEDEKIGIEEALIRSLEKLDKQRNLIREIKKEEKKEKFECECLDCGNIFETDKHCRDIKCSKCGGKTRRLERPGPGKEFEQKAGRVLSSKNRQKIQNTISTMKLAISSLQDLLQASEISAEGGESKSKGRREVACKPVIDTVTKRALVLISKNIDNILTNEKRYRKGKGKRRRRN